MSTDQDFKFEVGQLVKHKAASSFEKLLILRRYRDMDNPTGMLSRLYIVSHQVNGIFGHSWLGEDEVEAIP